MPIPEGTEPLYVWAILWAALNLALLAAFSQLPKDADLADRVHARTFRRLADLNEYMQAMLDNWSGRTTEDLIGDSDALHALKRKVDRAAYVESLVNHRTLSIALGRLIVLLELAAALAFGVLVYLKADREVISGAGIVVAGLGAVAAVFLLVYTSTLTARIVSGVDFS